LFVFLLSRRITLFRIEKHSYANAVQFYSIYVCVTMIMEIIVFAE
jgi:hypothetical protein